jgi:hypothetical protein
LVTLPWSAAGLSGRKLKLPDNLVNPSGKFRIGLKRAVNLAPNPLLERISKERLEKDWEPGHKLNLAQVKSRSRHSSLFSWSDPLFNQIGPIWMKNKTRI